MDVTMIEGYGPFRKGQTYPVVDRGRDYLVLKNGNKRIIVSPELTCVPQVREEAEDSEEDYSNE